MKCSECKMKGNTHKLDCSKRHEQDKVDDWLFGLPRFMRGVKDEDES